MDDAHDDLSDLKIAIDSVNHRIQIEALTSAIGDKDYSFEVHYYDPSHNSWDFQFDLPVRTSASTDSCATAII